MSIFVQRSFRVSRRASRACFLVGPLLWACSGGGDRTATDSAAAVVPAVPADSAARVMTATNVGASEGFKTPESVRYDADLDVYFVSNINGNPSQKDGNGFISRVMPDSSATATMLAEGGKSGVTLNAPKGMAIVGDTLWVADIDAVRAFDKRTGRAVATVNLASLGATFLNDVTAGPDGAIYITDTGVRFDASGGMSHPGKDRIFRIAGRTPSIAYEGPGLSSPNGIAWDSANNRFLLAPFDSKEIGSWAPGDSAVKPFATGPGGYDGVEVLSDGRVLVTSWNDSTVSVVVNGTAQPLVRSVEAPADLGVDTKRNRIALPRFNAGTVEYWQIPPR